MARVSVKQSNSFRVPSGFIIPQTGVNEGIWENNNTIWGQNTYAWEHIYLLNYTNKNSFPVKTASSANLKLASTKTFQVRIPQQTLVRI
tara:strand:- start:6070 stop:6336 length:267 start_codon:yes stop_codon:yes gene_type:complete